MTTRKLPERLLLATTALIVGCDAGTGDQRQEILDDVVDRVAATLGEDRRTRNERLKDLHTRIDKLEEQLDESGDGFDPVLTFDEIQDLGNVPPPSPGVLRTTRYVKTNRKGDDVHVLVTLVRSSTYDDWRIAKNGVYRVQPKSQQ